MEKDLSTKVLTKCADVFSDICNVNLFGCREVLRPEELEEVSPELEYHGAGGKLREHHMDVRMRHKCTKTEFAVFGLENQTGVCNTMPVRDMGYVYSGYSEQIRQIRQKNEQKGIRYYSKEIGDDQKLMPVINLILYYGLEKWSGPETLLDMLSIPDEWRPILEPLLENHRIRIVHLAAQDEETRKKYQSDFRHVVDYLAYIKQKDREKLKKYMHDRSRIVVHPQEYLEIMHAFTSDGRYRIVAEKVREREEKGEKFNMCILMDLAEEEGMKKGMKEGFGKGREKGLKEVNLLNIRLAADGRTEDIIQAAGDMVLQEKLMEEYDI